MAGTLCIFSFNPHNYSVGWHCDFRAPALQTRRLSHLSEANGCHAADRGFSLDPYNPKAQALMLTPHFLSRSWEGHSWKEGYKDIARHRFKRSCCSQTLAMALHEDHDALGHVLTCRLTGHDSGWKAEARGRAGELGES